MSICVTTVQKGLGEFNEKWKMAVKGSNDAYQTVGT